MKNQNLICLDVINTMWYDYRSTGNSEDRLTNPKWVSYFMKDWGLSHLQYPNDHIIKELQALRDLMRGLIKKATHNEDILKEDLSKLNSFMEKVERKPSLIYEDQEFKIHWVSSESDWDSFISEVAMSFSMLFTQNQHKKN